MTSTHWVTTRAVHRGQLHRSRIGEKFSLAFHAGYSWGDYWENSVDELIDYAVQGNWTVGNFTIFAKFTGTDASDKLKVEDDVNNNEPRASIGVMTTFPWGD